MPARRRVPEFTLTAVKVKISGLGAGMVSISGPGLKTTRRTISAASTATLTAGLTSKGKQLRRAQAGCSCQGVLYPEERQEGPRRLLTQGQDRGQEALTGNIHATPKGARRREPPTPPGTPL